MEVNNLVKKYGKKEVLNIKHADFNMKGIIGVLGLNGAGKTTFFKSMSDLVVSNQISKYKKEISFFPDSERFLRVNSNTLGNILYATYDDFNLEIFKKILQELNIDGKKGILSLSKGQKNILNIVMTISRDTKYYFIDELFSNLDFETREIITKVIIEYADVNNKLIFISSHEIDDVERLIDYAVVLRDKSFSKVESIADIVKKHKSLYNWFELIIEGGV
jgi:ABC-2 type transport system ATP-binding protein